MWLSFIVKEQKEGAVPWSLPASLPSSIVKNSQVVHVRPSISTHRSQTSQEPKNPRNKSCSPRSRGTSGTLMRSFTASSRLIDHLSCKEWLWMVSQMWPKTWLMRSQKRTRKMMRNYKEAPQRLTVQKRRINEGFYAHRISKYSKTGNVYFSRLRKSKKQFWHYLVKCHKVCIPWINAWYLMLASELKMIF